jgi:hypothetical protein
MTPISNNTFEYRIQNPQNGGLGRLTMHSILEKTVYEYKTQALFRIGLLMKMIAFCDMLPVSSAVS